MIVMQPLAEWRCFTVERVLHVPKITVNFQRHTHVGFRSITSLPCHLPRFSFFLSSSLSLTYAHLLLINEQTGMKRCYRVSFLIR